MRGWVYVITNRAMPNLVKIGFSTKDPAMRAAELAGTGIPFPYEVEFDALVDNPRLVEQAAHQSLSSARVGKEWFSCSIAVAIEVIRKNAGDIHLQTEKQKEVDVNKDFSSLDGTVCEYYACNEPAALFYKTTPFCASHARLMRQMRFAKVRA